MRELTKISNWILFLLLITPFIVGGTLENFFYLVGLFLSIYWIASVGKFGTLILALDTTKSFSIFNILNRLIFISLLAHFILIKYDSINLMGIDQTTLVIMVDVIFYLSLAAVTLYAAYIYEKLVNNNSSIFKIVWTGIMFWLFIYTKQSDFQKIKLGLEKTGYYHNGNQGIEDRDVFKRNGKLTNKILDTLQHHLYVCPIGSGALERHILSRDFLRKNEWAKIKYQQMKYELAEKANQDRKLYAALKELNINDFIDSIIKKEKRTHNMAFGKSEAGGS